MFDPHRWRLSWIVLSLLCAGCSGSAGTVPMPQPSVSPAPPIALGRGTLAVISHKGSHEFVLIFPPNGDQPTHQIPIHDEHGQHLKGNSLAFDRRGHLYIGMHDTSQGGKYYILEVDIHNWVVVRDIVVSGWSFSSVATDNENYLYVNTKAAVGGDIDIFRDNRETKPYLEIKDHHNPVSTFVARDALWVGYSGLFSRVLARYRLRSTERTLFEPISTGRVDAMTVNPEGSLVAVLTKDASRPTAHVFDVNSKRLRKLLEAAQLSAMTSDESGDLFIGEYKDREWTIAVTDFGGNSFGRITSSAHPAQALAVSPLDGTLYVASRNASDVRVYNSQNGKFLKDLPVGFNPSALAFEP